MVNYKKLLNRIEKEKRDLREEKMFIPSQLSSSKKKSIGFDIGEKQKDLTKKT